MQFVWAVVDLGCFHLFLLLCQHTMVFRTTAAHRALWVVSATEREPTFCAQTNATVHVPAVTSEVQRGHPGGPPPNADTRDAVSAGLVGPSSPGSDVHVQGLDAPMLETPTVNVVVLAQYS